jgi:hypothetical protein
LLVRNSASRLIGTPGSTSFRKCDQVFGKLTQSPESNVRMGGKFASNTPSRIVFLFESTTWMGPPTWLVAAAVSPVPVAWASLPNQGPTAARAPIKLLAWSN